MDNNERNNGNQHKVRDGRMMQGICSQWIVDNALDIGCTSDLIGMYNIIARNTFGYRKRDGYIEQALFGLHRNTIKKHRDRLTELGLIEWQATRAYTRYKIIEPREEIANFAFAHGSAISLTCIDQVEPQASGSEKPIYDPNEEI